MYITNNTLRSIYTVGIWTEQNLGVNVNGNVVELNATRSINTSQISPGNGVTGIRYYFAYGSFTSGFMNENRVTGQNPADQTNYKYQVGILAEQYQSLSRNTLQQLNVGVAIGSSSSYSFALFDNKFTDCPEGVQFLPNAFAILQRSGTARCNTFEKVNSGIGTVYGFRTQGTAWIPTLGQPGSPNGNRFPGIDVPVENSGSNTGFGYYRLNSLQENISNVGGNTGGFLTTDNSVSPINYCQNNSAFYGNGVNSARQAPTPYAIVEAIMDSVRLRQVSFVRQKDYQQQIVAYFTSQNDLPALERYSIQLITANSEAYGSIGLYLLEVYTNQHNTARSQAVRNALLRNLPREAEVRNRILLHDVLAHVDQWPLAGQRLPQADSAALQSVYTSGTSAAEKAGTWLRYYYPHAAPYRAPNSLPAASIAKTKQITKQAYVEAAYPNPAATSLTLRYNLVRPVQNAELQIHDLLTGRQVLIAKIPAGDTQKHEQQIDLTRLPAGNYSYRVVVDGLPMAPQHLVIQK